MNDATIYPNTVKMLTTLGELKATIRRAKTLYVWVNWQGDDGDYIAVSKAAFLRGIGADSPFDGAHGGRHDGTHVRAREDDGDVYVN